MCNFLQKILNPQNVEKSVSDILIWFPFESSFWISVSGCKLTILQDIHSANRIMIIFAILHLWNDTIDLHYIRPLTVTDCTLHTFCNITLPRLSCTMDMLE